MVARRACDTAVMEALALVVIAIAQVAAALAARRRSVAPIQPSRLPPDSPGPRPYHAYFVPLACGIAVESGRLTEPCGRRRSHGGRCMSERELEQASDLAGGRTELVVPTTLTAVAAPDDGRAAADISADLAALAHHMETCPAAIGTRLTGGDLEWLLRMRFMVEALVSGDRFSQWDATKA